MITHGTGAYSHGCRCEICVAAKRAYDKEYRAGRKKPARPAKSRPADMRVCWRCGVDFDYAPFTNDAPCPDCQYDVEGDWVGGWNTNQYNVYPELYEQRARIIRDYWNEGKSDVYVSEQLGIDPSTVLRWRRELGLPANSRGGFYTHKDQEASRARMSALGTITGPQNRVKKPERWWKD